MKPDFTADELGFMVALLRRERAEAVLIALRQQCDPHPPLPSLVASLCDDMIDKLTATAPADEETDS